LAEHLADNQGAPATPASGTSFLYPSTGSRQWSSKDDTGLVLSLPGISSVATADILASAADTYLAGLAVPPHGLQAKTFFKWRFYFSKTAAGVVAPIWRVRVGTAGTTADTARLTFTGVAQTAAVDNAFVEINAVLRAVGGASGVLAGGLALQKAAVTAVGLTNTVGGLVLQNTSGTFDTTVANLIVGVSVDPGASGVFTHQVVFAQMFGD
jgi:hypothetical protein